METRHFSPQDSVHKEFIQRLSQGPCRLVVGDPASKSHLLETWLMNHDVIDQDRVMTWSEWTTQLMIRSQPQQRRVSQQWLLAALREHLQEEPLEWASGPGAARLILDYIRHALPILVDPQGFDLMKSWFQSNPRAFEQWGLWFFAAHRIWNWCLDHHWYLEDWSAGLLLNQKELRPSEPMIFHLGAHFDRVQVQLLEKLAGSVDVTHYVPSTEVAESHGAVQFPRYNSSLAEVKAAVHWTRKLLDKGVEAQQIHLVVTRPSHYLPSLMAHFELEGIPLNVPVQSKVWELPSVQQWLARLRLRAGDLQSEDIEQDLFPRERQWDGPHSKFRRQFKNLYEEQSLERQPFLRQRYLLKKDRRLNLDSFIEWALPQWKFNPMAEEPLQFLLSALLEEAPHGHKLQPMAWVQYLESLSQSLMWSVQEAQGGVDVVALHSSWDFEAEWVFAMGLSESQMREPMMTSISPQDVQRIESDLGFVLAQPDQVVGDRSLEWLIQRPLKELICSFSETNFEAQVEAPSVVWLRQRFEKRGEVESLQTPEWGRWQAWHWSTPPKPTQEFQVASKSMQTLRPTLSATQVVNYLNCPFKFAAMKLLRLSDLPDVDLDVDAMTRGLMMHALFEQLKSKKAWALEEIVQLVEQLRTDLKLEFGDESLWQVHRGRFVHMAQDFLQFESEWEKDYPQNAIRGCEVEIKAGIDEESGQWRPWSEDAWTFRGSIDRVDQTEDGTYTIYDYKSSAGATSHHGRWVESQKLQLPLYALALEQGLSALPAAPVSAAFYYVLREKERGKGFCLETNGSAPVNRFNKVNEEEKTGLLESSYELFQQAFHEIREGHFNPQPKEPQKCGECQWNQMCRAQHLN